MRKILALVLILLLISSACTSQNKLDDSLLPVGRDFSESAITTTGTRIPEISMGRNSSVISQVTDEYATDQTIGEPVEIPNFNGLSDPALLRYVEDKVYSDVITNLDSDLYFVENVSALYISKEYLDEFAYNSQANVYFGYTISELEEQFQGEKYIFTLGENGQTTVQAFQHYDDSFDKIVRNVAIGSGVILLCVTVSTVTAGSAPAVSMIFAASAKSSAIFALSDGVFSAATNAIVTGLKTDNLGNTIKEAAISGSEGFACGAIMGAVAGGYQKAVALKGATIKGLTLNEVATIQRESKYPLDVIKTINMEQYKILQEGGLVPITLNGKTALVPKNIDIEFVNGMGDTNLKRLEDGANALDAVTGLPYEWHHIGQQVDSTLALLTKSQHKQGGNYLIWHDKGVESLVHAPGNSWDTERKILNESYANFLMFQ